MSKFENLQRTNFVEDDEFDDDAPIELSPEFRRLIEIDRLQRELAPTSAEWAPTVFYDPEVFPTEASLERVERHYEQVIPGRNFSFRALPLSAVETALFFKFPAAEKLFRHRGFILETEGNRATQGQSNAISYRERAKAVSEFQLSTIAMYLDLENVDSSDTWKAYLAFRLGAAFGEVNGQPIPLIERDGLLLPCKIFYRAERIHLAYGRGLKLAIKNGRSDPHRLCPALPEEILEQVTFERRHSQPIFGGATPTALLLWQTQALAFLRKAAGEIELITDAEFNKREAANVPLRQAALRILLDPEEDLGAAGLDEIVSPDCAALAAYQVDYLAEIAEIAAENPADAARRYGVAHGACTIVNGLTDEQNIVAALHGSHYRPQLIRDSERYSYHPLDTLLPVARWIFELKRRRHAVLGHGIAKLLRDVIDPEAMGVDGQYELYRFRPLIEDRLGQQAWSVLHDSIAELLNHREPGPIPVVYEWNRDAITPWFAERRVNAIYIRGPFLDFPISAANVWNEKATVLRKERGLVFKRRPR